MRALLVEDEVLVAMIAEEALTSLGFEAFSARNAAEAIAQFETLAPALAVIDVGLPDLRGDELAVRLRALSPLLSIVMASGYDEFELRVKFRDDVRVVVMAKPYTQGDLARATRSLGFNSAAG